MNDSNKIKARFAKNCLLARRLVERGVRFVQLFNGSYAMSKVLGNCNGHKRSRNSTLFTHRFSTSRRRRC